MRRFGAAFTVALVALAGCAGGDGPASGPPTDPSPSGSSPSPSASASPAGTYAGTRVRLGSKASVVVPEGWAEKQITNYADPAGFPADATQEALCLLDPAQARPEWVDCTLLIQYGSAIVGNEGRPWTSRQPMGWYTRTDFPVGCPVPADATPAGGYDTMDFAGGRQEEGTATVGGRTAELTTYTVTCMSGAAFSPRAWWLAGERILATDVLGHPRNQEILDSVQFTN